MYRSYIKRALDILISLMALPFVAVLAIPIGLAIKLEDRGSILFHSIRLGRDMQEFRMLKFRTMKENAPDIRNQDGTTYNASDDPRVTATGRILRKTSLDELPQFINVLAGDMSFIGPRPSPQGDKSQYPEEFFKKYKVRPGITGYNQALMRNAASMEDRIRHDAYYVDHLSFSLDLKIIWWTIAGVITGKNINRQG